MKKIIVIFIFSFLGAITSTCARAQPINGSSQGIAVRPSDFDEVMDLIKDKVDIRAATRMPVQVQVGGNSMAFISRQPLFNKKSLPAGFLESEDDKFFIVRTIFLFGTPTVEKRVIISQGPEEDARLRFILENGDEAFEQFLYDGLGLPMQVYNRSGEMIVYMQAAAPGGTVEMKEYIYARRPNCPRGSRYVWDVKSEEFFRRLVLKPADKGAVDIQRQVIIREVDANDYDHQRNIINSIHKIMPQAHIKGEDTIGTIEPVYYITREGQHKKAEFVLQGRDKLIVQINEPASSYPLLIESD